MITRFKNNIDLMDETLREGAERSFVNVDISDKVEIAIKLSDIGIKTIVIGMFPDIPHNIELLKKLIILQDLNIIKKDVRFMVISHIGKTMWKTLEVFEDNAINSDSVWIIAIHSVSDLQLLNMFPSVIGNSQSGDFNFVEWNDFTDAERKHISNDYFDSFLDDFTIKFPKERIMIGLLDSFRADNIHIKNVVGIIRKKGVSQVRLVDTAGTCTLHDLLQLNNDVLQLYEDIDFYGHFHDDFGMATSNAILGLSLGFKGVDVSVGGFANRAGHPPLAEISTALKELYNISLVDFQYDKLFELSRFVENIYCLIESPCQPITGIITHTVQSGIRTELIKKHPKIFDVIDPELYGNEFIKMFGIRSGIDGVRRIIKNNHKLSNFVGDSDIVDIYNRLIKKWGENTEVNLLKIRGIIRCYHDVVSEMVFSEDNVVEVIENIVLLENEKFI